MYKINKCLSIYTSCTMMIGILQEYCKKLTFEWLKVAALQQQVHHLEDRCSMVIQA